MSTPETNAASNETPKKPTIKEQLEHGLGSPTPKQPSDDHAEWVRLLYTQYTAQFLSDNSRIWTTATIFLPLSLAGLVKLGDLELYDTILLGVGSSLLAWFWFVIAEHHRAFQTTSKNITKVIEEHIGFVSSAQKTDRSRIMNFEPLYTVQKVRRLMCYCITGIWIFAIGGKVYHRITSPHASPTATASQPN